MNFKSIVLMSTLLCSVSVAEPFQNMSSGELAELGLHKLERLTTGANPRFEKSFQSQTVEINVFPAGGNTIVHYLQGAAADGTRKTATITLMNDGMIMGTSANQASTPSVSLQLPGANAIVILEYSLHCVQGENIGGTQLCATTTALREFDQKLSKALLTPVMDTAGTIIGSTVEIFGRGMTQKAVISFTIDGSLASESPIQFVKL